MDFEHYFFSRIKLTSLDTMDITICSKAFNMTDPFSECLSMGITCPYDCQYLLFSYSAALNCIFWAQFLCNNADINIVCKHKHS